MHEIQLWVKTAQTLCNYILQLYWFSKPFKLSMSINEENKVKFRIK